MKKIYRVFVYPRNGCGEQSLLLVKAENIDTAENIAIAYEFENSGWVKDLWNESDDNDRIEDWFEIFVKEVLVEDEKELTRLSSIYFYLDLITEKNLSGKLETSEILKNRLDNEKKLN